MPNMRNRTHSKINAHKKTTSGAHTIHRERRLAEGQKCAKCRSVLLGIPRTIKNRAASQKKISRPYGGNLCAKCHNDLIKISIRSRLQ